ncbi:Holliday junction resolvase RuvX [Blochmannia endosymbiont of Polyrhachis (Hedomyrma) turneri]|uniref:Holliday junction resolvase RuvX n=1 Tax=Blochmannia endosymbiont of Polyrhachis (Hedomyrma) turneri TaxID=1505596 RepID=UPI00061A8801|nr:Holliday junction resolvase RuvX [Blochmannia endosymbiont of Polyrhachis (Hedomyrma) turneri]AKC59821.1 putative Holliday junction resolvase [Blochmannia endosymbiont of Polyrhachis (Hedomyrma) turneri]
MKITGIVMGFDFGLKNIGIAVGQQLTYTAQPITTLQTKKYQPNWDIMKKIFNIWQPKIFIVGLPININGTNQPLTYLTYEFSKMLHKTFDLKVIMQDERFSTIEARSRLFKYHGFRSLKPNQINSISAVIILESWLQKT